MILYSTRIPMKKEFDREAFLSSILKWNASGKSCIAGLEEHLHSYNFEVTDGENSLYSVTLESELITAVRVCNENKGGVWHTDLILNEDKSVMTICLNRFVRDTTKMLSGLSNVPKIAEQVIKDGFAENNLVFPLSDTAIRINSGNRSALESLVNGEAVFSLPIVYLSSRSQLNADELAGKLTGLASVVLDDAYMIDQKYPAPIYIFYPHKILKPKSFGDYPLHREIISEIVEYLNNQMYEDIDTWNGVKNKQLDIESQKNAQKYLDAASENEALSELQDDFLKQEQENKKERDRLFEEIRKLEADVFGLTKRLEKAGLEQILNMGEEKDMYPGEHLEIVIEILKEYLSKSVDDDSRRHDVLKSIVDANHTDNIPEKYRQIIKNAFDGYRDFSCKKIQDALRETGIEVINHSGHYKIAFHGDTRYTYEAASTPSDSRSGKNCSTDINKLMF